MFNVFQINNNDKKNYKFTSLSFRTFDFTVFSQKENNFMKFRWFTDNSFRLPNLNQIIVAQHNQLMVFRKKEAAIEMH